MKVVIDTNIVVSAALKDRDPEAIIRFVISHPNYDWIASQAIITEYSEVLRRPKFRLPTPLVQEWTDLFDTAITLVYVSVSVDFPRDQKDAKFLACAIATDADFLISGDRDLTEAYMLHTTVVCSVKHFKQLVIDIQA